jgi:hypothetical protein
MKGGHHRIELFGHRAHRAGWLAEDRQRLLTWSTEGPRTKHDSITRSTCSGRRASARSTAIRREAAGARSRELDGTELGQ